MARALTAKQEAFIRAFLTNGRHATNAYRAAYNAAGMSDNSASKEADKLLKHPRIAPRIQESAERAAELTGLSAARVLAELGLVAFSDVAAYTVDDQGRLVVSDPALTRAVASVKRKLRPRASDPARPVEDVETEVKLWPKVEALKVLAEHLGLVKKRLEVTGKDGAPLLDHPGRLVALGAFTPEGADGADQILDRLAALAGRGDEPPGPGQRGDPRPILGPAVPAPPEP